MRGFPGAIGSSLTTLSVVVLAAIAIIDSKPMAIEYTKAAPAKAANCPAPALAGVWINDNPNTRGLSRLEIFLPCHQDLLVSVSAQSGNKLPWKVRAWGRCHPADCAWGQANSVDAETADGSAQTMTAYFDRDLAHRTISIAYSQDALVVDTATDFIDPAREDYRVSEHFVRVAD